MPSNRPGNNPINRRSEKRLKRLSTIPKKGKKMVADLLRGEVNRFSRDTLADIGANLSGKVLKRRSGKLASSIPRSSGIKQSGIDFTITFGSDMEYAAIHEYGGVTEPTVTPRMRRFAWHKFFQTGDVMWSRLARTRKSNLRVPIPARPYIGPAIQGNIDPARARFRATLEKTVMHLGRS